MSGIRWQVHYHGAEPQAGEWHIHLAGFGDTPVEALSDLQRQLAEIDTLAARKAAETATAVARVRGELAALLPSEKGSAE